jgi:2-keto-4-pentenoate hydratase/2-oxohepta-3-ene-1,7-dioic acid hydratase in catechol pathway
MPARVAAALPFPRPPVLFCVDDNYRCQPVTRRAGLALQKPAAIVPFLTGDEIEDVLITAADPDALTPSGSQIIAPRGCERLDVGVALGVVMSADGTQVSGYVAALDVLRGDIPQHQTFLARSFPTHKVVSTELTARVHRSARIQLRIDGELRQDSQLDQMIADVETLTGTIRAHHPLNGAVILTGSPGGRPHDSSHGYLLPGATVEGRVSGIAPVSAEVVAE